MYYLKEKLKKEENNFPKDENVRTMEGRIDQIEKKDNCRMDIFNGNEKEKN